MGFGKKDKNAFSVHRSEEVMPNTLRHLVRQSSSLSSNEGLGSEEISRFERESIGVGGRNRGRDGGVAASIGSSNSSGGGSHKSAGGSGSKSNSRKASPAASGARLTSSSAPPSVESDDSRDKDG